MYFLGLFVLCFSFFVVFFVLFCFSPDCRNLFRDWSLFFFFHFNQNEALNISWRFSKRSLGSSWGPWIIAQRSLFFVYLFLVTVVKIPTQYCQIYLLCYWVTIIDLFDWTLEFGLIQIVITKKKEKRKVGLVGLWIMLTWTYCVQELDGESFTISLNDH